MPIVACCIFRVFFRVWQEPSPLYILICSKLEDRVTTSLQINISSLRVLGQPTINEIAAKKDGPSKKSWKRCHVEISLLFYILHTLWASFYLLLFMRYRPSQSGVAGLMGIQEKEQSAYKTLKKVQSYEENLNLLTARGSFCQSLWISSSCSLFTRIAWKSGVLLKYYSPGVICGLISEMARLYWSHLG